MNKLFNQNLNSTDNNGSTCRLRRQTQGHSLAPMQNGEELTQCICMMNDVPVCCGGWSQDSALLGVNIVAGVHFQVISAGNTPEIVTICGMVDTLSIDACQISNPLLKHFIKSR